MDSNPTLDPRFYGDGPINRKNLYLYRAYYLKNYDGDTIDFLVDLGFNNFRIMRFRSYGIDAYEMRGAEKEKGKEARDILQSWIKDDTEFSGTLCDAIKAVFKSDKWLYLRSFKDRSGKYGRYLAEVITPMGENLNLKLVFEGFAEVNFYD